MFLGERENIMWVLRMKRRPAVFCLRENSNVLNVMILRVCYGSRQFFFFFDSSRVACISIYPFHNYTWFKIALKLKVRSCVGRTGYKESQSIVKSGLGLSHSNTTTNKWIMARSAGGGNNSCHWGVWKLGPLAAASLLFTPGPCCRQPF